ncbi:hypothetical protein ACFVAJ_18025 [Agromyces sp. NPDC057679]|uniref:hypothetical protein n=1 Tax=Agromyces sp. NPDC057679 TaxID=3346207 RepID=UPI00366FB10C
MEKALNDETPSRSHTVPHPDTIAFELTEEGSTGYGAIDAAIDRGDIRIEDVRALIADAVKASRTDAGL